MPGVAVAAVAILKPFVLLWAALNAIDDFALLFRVGRLGISVVPFPPGRQSNNPRELCGVCDDVMDDLLGGIGSLHSIPCDATCFGLKRCKDMCHRLREVAADSNEFPCIAAGFCDPVGMDGGNNKNIVVPKCKTGAFFSCTPSRYCRRTRKGMKWSCALKPGIGHWVGLRKALARDHAGALVAGLMSQSHCGEPGAGPYCIARPKGVGIVAEYIGHFLSFAVGTQKSIVAIESRGGSDDRQWLTFWVIITILHFIERFFARVLLSSFPYYYQVKLLILIWLVWWNGADTFYRKLRRFLAVSDEAEAAEELKIMQSIGNVFVKTKLTWLRNTERVSQWNTDDWDYDWDDNDGDDGNDATQQLYELSKFILSAEGARKLKEAENISTQDKMLLVERAASVISFQPRFLRVRIVGTIDGPRGQLPPMDANGLADPYVVCRLVPQSGKPYPKYGVSTKILHNTLTPQWNQELEIPLRGGTLDTDGFFRCDDDIGTTQLELIVRDADIGMWKVSYHLSRIVAIGLAIVATVAYVEGSGDFTQFRQQAVLGVATSWFVLSYIMAVSRKSDYENVGQCIVPIGMLMDQGEHALLLTLRAPIDEKKLITMISFKQKAKVCSMNSTGGFGILRVQLVLSER